MSTSLLTGDARDVLKGLPADHFHCAVTSPPYFGLRKYKGGEVSWEDGWRGQLGGEPTPEVYIEHLIQIMREVKRVLRPDGCFFINVGDSWAGSGGTHKPEHANLGLSKSAQRDDVPLGSIVRVGCKSLDMVLIPEQLALAAREDGWYVRSIIIWAKGVSGGGGEKDYSDVIRAWASGKQITGGDAAVDDLIARLDSPSYNGNPMPESVNGWRWVQHKVKIGDNGRGKEAWRVGANETPQQDHDGSGNFKSSAIWQDCPGCPKCSPNSGLVLRKGSWRPTDSYEYILMLTKTDSYFCDREAVIEPIAQSTIVRGKVSFGGEKGRNYNPSKDDPNYRSGSEQWGREYDYTVSNNGGGRNLRSVVTQPTHPFGGTHFATYPPKLIEPLIKVATSAKGCCPKCGSPWARVIDGRRLTRPELPKEDVRYCPNVYNGAYSDINGHGDAGYTNTRTLGWKATCSCGLESTPCRVLDPFSGAGTTALVCKQLGLDSVSIDTSPEYVDMSYRRLIQSSPLLPEALDS